MENALVMHSKIFFRSEGYQYNQSLDQELVANLNTQNVTIDDNINVASLLTWTGKYGFIGMNALGMGVASHGMNSEGLATGDMTLVATKYQPYDQHKKTNLA